MTTDNTVTDRALSVLTAVCLVISSFVGLLFLTDITPARASNGDLIVQDGTYVIQDIDQFVDGNVTVLVGGELVLRNSTLSIISTNDPANIHGITVSSGGKLILENSTITSYLEQDTTWPFLTLSVVSGGIVAGSSSVLMFPGTIHLSSGAKMSLNSTVVTAQPVDKLVEHYAGGDTLILDTCDDGPSISVQDSELLLVDSSIDALPEFPVLGAPAANISLMGSSNLLATNSYIGIDFGPANTTSDWYTHNVLSISDISTAELYGCHFDNYSGAPEDRAPPVAVSGSSYLALPTTKGPEDNTGQNLMSLLASGEGMTYHVGTGQTMAIDSFDAGSAGPVNGATLIVRYKVDAGYDGTRSLLWSTNEGTTFSSTGIFPAPSETPFVESSCDLYAMGVTTTTFLSTLDIKFLNDGTNGYVQFDSLMLVLTIGSQAYIYRWLNLTVGDEYGVPIPGATVTASFTGSSPFAGQGLFYLGHGGASLSPPTEVLNYLNKNPMDFTVTDQDGLAVIPFITDIVTDLEGLGSINVGSFDITATAVLSMLPYFSIQSFSFPSYPAMTADDQQSDLTIRIMGVSAPSPDPSRWLVAPPNILIENTTFSYSGDIIIAPAGMLEVIHSEFILMQDYSFQRTIYVDGTTTSPASLVFDGSSVASIHPIRVIVEGNGTFEAHDTIFDGVSIVALESAVVMLQNVTLVNGSITCSPNSNASLEISDSVLSNSPQLSGNAVARIRGTCAPSVDVSDDAVAFIYRWIMVTVLDGADMPLPGVNVSTRYYVDETPGSLAVTSFGMDSLGIARIDALSTILNSTGTVFVGNYWINATYTYLPMIGQQHYAPSELSVGVTPYTEPLGRSESFVTMSIPDALSDLTVNQGQVPVWSDIPNPARGDNVTIYARINNSGIATAYDVSVEFFDNQNGDDLPQESELIGSASIPMIAPDGSAIAQTSWVASLPLDPMQHEIIVLADSLDSVPEIFEDPLAMGFGNITVQGLPDFAVSGGEQDIYTVPAEVVINTFCILNAVVYNIGDIQSISVEVEFYDGSSIIGACVVDIEPYSMAVASMTGVFTTIGLHIVTVLVNPDHAIAESDYLNNNASREFAVLDYPNLGIGTPVFMPPLQVPGTAVVNVSAEIWNLNPAPFSDPIVRMYVDYGNNSMMTEISLSATLTNDTGPVGFSISFVAPNVTETTVLTVTLVVNPYLRPETTYVDNMVVDTIDVMVNQPPVAYAGDDQTVTVGDEVTLSGADSFDDVEISSYVWTFEYDGHPVVLYAENMSFIFLIDGIYNITLTVTDNTGQAANDTVCVTVTPVIPEYPTLLLPISGLLMLIVMYRFAPRQLLRRRMNKRSGR